MARASLVLIFIACFGLNAFSAEESSVEWIRAFAKHTDKDNPIPKELAQKLEDDYKEATKDPKSEHEKPLIRHLMIVTTDLTQDRVRSLKGPTSILTAPGGGSIDLSDYVTPLKGMFRLKIKLENDHREAQLPARVYFISRSKVRQIGDEKFGAGCGKYYDITSFFNSKMAKGGFELYTADQRYVEVLRGTFVFASYSTDALQLASVTFYDSRYTAGECPEPEVL